MITKIYRVKGTFVMGDSYHKFTKEYKATNVADLEESSSKPAFIDRRIIE